MNIKITTLIISLLASTSALSSELIAGSQEEAAKGFYHHETYTKVSDKVSLGCESTYVEDDHLTKQTVIRVTSQDFIALPTTKVTATVSFGDGSNLAMLGKSTKTTETKFSYTFGTSLGKDVHDVLKSMIKNSTATLSIYDEDNSLILSDIISLTKKKSNMLQVIDMCLPDSSHQAN